MGGWGGMGGMGGWGGWGDGRRGLGGRCGGISQDHCQQDHHSSFRLRGSHDFLEFADCWVADFEPSVSARLPWPPATYFDIERQASNVHEQKDSMPPGEGRTVSNREQGA